MGDALNRELQSAPSYDGQFGPRVASIGHEALARARGLADRLTERSLQLRNKADAFQAVDSTARQGMDNVWGQLQAWSRSDAGWATLDIPLTLAQLHVLSAFMALDDDREPPLWLRTLLGAAEGWGRAVDGARSLVGLGTYGLMRAGDGARALVDIGFYGLLRASIGAEALTKIALHRSLRVPPAANVAETEPAESPPISGPTSGPFALGAPTRPEITHDNGFLETHPPEAPTLDDYVQLAQWRIKLQAAEILRPDLSEATASYRHFLDGGGEPRDFSYEAFVEGDASGALTLQNAIAEAQVHTEVLCSGLTDCSLTSQPFYVGGDDARFPYPATENWQKTIGAHPFWISTETTSQVVNGTTIYQMEFTLHAEDRYNFNPGMADIATGTPDSENGRFEITGLGHQYMHYGEITRTVTWQEGQAETTTTIQVPSEGAGSP